VTRVHPERHSRTTRTKIICLMKVTDAFRRRRTVTPGTAHFADLPRAADGQKDPGRIASPKAEAFLSYGASPPPQAGHEPGKIRAKRTAPIALAAAAGSGTSLVRQDSEDAGYAGRWLVTVVSRPTPDRRSRSVIRGTFHARLPLPAQVPHAQVGGDARVPRRPGRERVLYRSTTWLSLVAYHTASTSPALCPGKVRAQQGPLDHPPRSPRGQGPCDRTHHAT
jgi:hypothetical protein